MSAIFRSFKNPQHETELRAMLSLFPDRTTFEQWATAKQLTDAQRAHLERFLPAKLQAQGSV